MRARSWTTRRKASCAVAQACWRLDPKLKKAPGHLEHVRTPEGEPIPPNTLAELYREMERLRRIREQIQQIEKARLERLQHAPNTGPI